MAVKTKKKETLYDVVIYNTGTLIVARIAGEGMPLDSGYQNAKKRVDTVYRCGNIGEKYAVKIVPAGKFKEGSTLPRDKA